MNSPSHREDLSALLDGELERSQAAFLLRRLQHDRELRESWTHWQLIGECLRGNRTAVPAPAALAERVREAVTAAPVPRRRVDWLGGLRWAAGFATAAVVAASAFWYVQTRPVGGGAAEGVPVLAAGSGAAEVTSSGVRAADLRRQLPLLPVSSRSSRVLPSGEFAPAPDPEAWQKAPPVAPLYFPSTQYIIVLPAAPRQPAQERSLPAQ